jgi:hypothetical protein
MGQLADASYMQMIENPSGNYKGKQIVVFSVEGVINQEKTEKEGRPIHDDKEMIKIFIPGDKDNIIHTEVNDIHKKKYAAEYAKWKQSQPTSEEQMNSGTLLENLPGMLPSQIADLKHFNIRTVEHLANTSDSNVQKVGAINALKQRAKDYLATAAGMAPTTELRAAIKEKDNQIAALERQMKELGDKFEAMVKANRGETVKARG